MCLSCVYESPLAKHPMRQSILLVDDEKDILDLLKYNLEKEGYTVTTARDGQSALRLVEKRPDLIVLDVMMPGMDGYEVCKAIRKNPSTSVIPVMFLTAKAEEVDEVLGLELGADDYLTKPVRIRTFIARVKKALTKHGSTMPEPPKDSDTLVAGPVTIRVSNYVATVDKKDISFPRKEFEVLLFLARHPDRVVSRETLLNEVWGRDVYVVDRTVDVHIRKIREKLGRHADIIETVKGVGYRFRKDA